MEEDLLYLNSNICRIKVLTDKQDNKCFAKLVCGLYGQNLCMIIERQKQQTTLHIE